MALVLVSAPLMLAAAVLRLATGGSGPEMTFSDTPATVAGLPAGFEQLYRAAANTCPGLDWHVLAAIGKIETDHGRSQLPGVKSGTNYAGAAGPMQFLITTWGGSAQITIGSRFNGYASDGDGDGVADVYNPADAILAAAKYLCAHGAQRNLRQAIYAYNHSWDYVNSVLSQADRYRSAAATTPPSGISNPADLPAQQPSGADRITPRMRVVRDQIKQLFRVPYGIGCYRANGGIKGGGEHPLGRACDFMLSKGGVMPSAGEQARGDAIAAWVQANASRLGIYYIIWRRRIWNPSRSREGWRPMADRGSITENHFDHVHVSVR
ncbi:lytic transglycosylase domain-containing protein [Nonomuraea sp. NPDC049784]|uniref:lytic transglycosylase domain-containing protein n=1 Tax=Nonomuraea sp. NPDC049784 TaxID=3154361 RepID=UPI0033D6B857